MTSQKLAEQREATRLQRELVDTQTIMRMETGRRFVWRLLSICGVYQSPVGETEAILRQIGKKDFGLELLGIVGDADDEMLFQMMRESKERAQAENFNIDLEQEEYKKQHEGGHATMIDELV